jgi:ATP synthase protein I
MRCTVAPHFSIAACIALSTMEEKDRKLIRMLGVLSTVGITLVAATVIGLFIGLKLDKFFGTSPWLTALFLLLGLIAGFRNLFLYTRRSQEAMDEDNKEHPKGKP